MIKKILLAIAFLALGCWLGYRIGSVPQTQEENWPEKRLVQEKVVPAEKEPERITYDAGDKEMDEANVTKVIPKKSKVMGRIAIVLDDWGYNLKAHEAMVNLGQPITLAVLPHLPYSKRIAKDAYNAGHEIILHMPMQPMQNISLEKETLIDTMDSETVRSTLISAIDAMPYLRGVSNHQGSKFTQSAEGMQSVLETVQGQGLYFLNSLVTHNTTTGQIAETLGIPYLERDVFIDNNRDIDSIKIQLQKLKAKALYQGYAIGIGHDESVTMQAIKDVIPQWTREGIVFVRLSELLKQQTFKRQTGQ